MSKSERGINFLENSRQTVNGRPFQKLIYNIGQDQKKLRIEQYIWVTSKKAYILTFGIDPSKLDEIAIDSGESIMNTFLIK